MSDYRTKPAWALDLQADDIPTREAAAKTLALFMSDISEHCYCAGWLIGNEDALWQACEKVEPFPYGMGTITADEVLTLRVLASLAGGWVGWRQGEGPDLVGDDFGSGKGCRFIRWAAEKQDPAMLVEDDGECACCGDLLDPDGDCVSRCDLDEAAPWNADTDTDTGDTQ